MVKLPPAFRITRKTPVPATSWSGAGSEALASEDRIWIECVTVGTSAHEASHALTVTKNGTPAVCGRGVPVLPEGLTGAAISPGINTCSRVNGPAIAVAALSWAAKTSASHNPPRAARSAWRTTNLLSTFVRCSSGDQTRPAPSPRFRVRGGRGDANLLRAKQGACRDSLQIAPRAGPSVDLLVTKRLRSSQEAWVAGIRQKNPKLAGNWLR